MKYSLAILLLLFFAASLKAEQPKYQSWHQSTNGKSGVFRNYQGQNLDKVTNTRYNTGNQGIFRNYRGQETNRYTSRGNNTFTNKETISRYGNKYLAKDHSGNRLGSYVTNSGRTVFYDNTGKTIGYAYESHGKIIYRDKLGRMTGSFTAK